MIELAYLNGHYDLIVDGFPTEKAVTPKPSPVIELSDSPCKITCKSTIDIKTECKMELKLEESQTSHQLTVTFASDQCQSNWESEQSDISSADEYFEDIKFKGGKRYINLKVFDSLDVIESDAVPTDID